MLTQHIIRHLISNLENLLSYTGTFQALSNYQKNNNTGNRIIHVYPPLLQVYCLFSFYICKFKKKN